MINEIKTFIQRYVTLPDDNIATVLALYVLHTWSWQLSDTTPYMYVWSPLKQSGKTRLLEVLEVLVHMPIRASSVTSAALYRVIEERNPTMLIDEVDTIYSGTKHEDLRGTLNSGYRRGGYSVRIRGGEVTDFSTYCPKVLAGINNYLLPDTIADRCISVELQRKPTDVKVEPFYHSKAMVEVESILERSDNWAQKNALRLKASNPHPISDVSDRKWEIGEPLAQIASVLKVKSYRNILQDVLSRNIPRNTLNETEFLMRGLSELYSEHDKMFSSDIAEYMEITPALLAKRLQLFNIAPKRIRIGNKVTKGYDKNQLGSLLERSL